MNNSDNKNPLGKFSRLEQFEFPEIASEIVAMAKVDQEMRQRNLKEAKYWDEEIDKKNTQRMKEIISQIGWPTVSKVGEWAANRAWLLVQHADHDPAFQRQCLDLMKAEPDGEVSKQDIAYLEDRVSLKETDFQIYGTQFIKEKGDLEFKPLPIKDPDNVEERRKSMNLGTLDQSIKTINNK